MCVFCRLSKANETENKLLLLLCMRIQGKKAMRMCSTGLEKPGGVCQVVTGLRLVFSSVQVLLKVSAQLQWPLSQQFLLCSKAYTAMD